MEKFTQFRDRGSGIAPFLPIPSQSAGFQLPIRVFLFWLRLPIFIFVCVGYFLILQWFPIGSLGKKASLWCILGIPSIWWIDLQVEGVRKGFLAQQQARLPGPGSVIASSFTSPIDAIYLAAIFDPIFTACYPNSRQVEQISLFQAVLRAFATPRVRPPPNARLVHLATLVRKYPGRPIVTFPECTTTNARGIMPLSPAIATAPANTKIFPISLRYTPADVVTPVPGCYLSFLWNLLSKPTHCIRVRIAEAIVSGEDSSSARRSTYDTNNLDTLDKNTASGSQGLDEPELTRSEKGLLDKVGDALARLGRVKRVGLTVRDKQDFVRTWTRTRRTW
ncbi:putative vacuolar protein sorting protein Vps66 [Aspergillus avenaceus]|uniref:Putative vacuolar protein sorting protein Vps66 n=1 Tax=Aspergillus avenaceus TaxID=36643 RepID=A0A5N6TEG6_ASPAV|nr:putative vacuolar protein sorting protein Vps66 [Aspergillus avenaceus]